jgi:DNA polymerase-3 subunit epsilon
MSIYLRTSIKLGPLRVGVSKSGIGVSAGIPGLRVGVSPRGSYVRMGSAGVYYQATTGGWRSARPAVPVLQSPGGVVLSDLTGAQTEALLPANPSTLVSQLNAAAKAHRIWPWALGVTLLLIVVTPWLLIPGALLTVWLAWQDSVRRTVVAFYEVDGPAHQRYQMLLNHFEAARAAHSAWHVVAGGALHTTYQRKVNAGAGSLVRREPLHRGVEGSSHLKANISVPSLQSSARSVYFLPDRVLIRDRNTYVDLSYDAFSVTWDENRFVEDGSVPRDARQVGTTWKYVNKDGGPDRRFKENRQLPVLLYGQIRLSGAYGLNILWSFSNGQGAPFLVSGIGQMRAALK